MSISSRAQWVVPILVVVWLAFSSSPAHAGVGGGNGEIGFDMGATRFDSNVTGEMANRFVFRGGYHLTDLFQLEGHLAGSVYTEGNFEISVSTFLADAVFNFHPSPNVVPYVLLGGGIATLEATLFGETFEDSSPAFQAGVGSRFFWGYHKRVAFRLEACYLTEKTFEERSGHASFVMGFTWRLGAPSR